MSVNWEHSEPTEHVSTETFNNQIITGFWDVVLFYSACALIFGAALGCGTILDWIGGK